MTPPTFPALPLRRSRWVGAVAALLVISLGLMSRRHAPALPAFVGSYLGDVLWALMVFLGLGCLWPRARTLSLGLATLLFCYLVEFSQLYQAPWINAVRQTTPGALVLGRGFLWSDLVCYGVGTLFGMAWDLGVLKPDLTRSPHTESTPARPARQPRRWPWQR